MMLQFLGSEVQAAAYTAGNLPLRTALEQVLGIFIRLHSLLALVTSHPAATAMLVLMLIAVTPGEHRTAVLPAHHLPHGALQSQV